MKFRLFAAFAVGCFFLAGCEEEDTSLEGDYVDEYGINHGQGIEIDGVVWAPVNCGYHATDYKYGKLYQWGRKYGQGYDGDFYGTGDGEVSGTYADAVVPSIGAGTVSLSIGQSASNSDKFFEVTSSISNSGGSGEVIRTTLDWLSPKDDALWNSGTETDPIKTKYDPCPKGWRVPTFTELNKLKTNISFWTTNQGLLGYWFSGGTPYSESVPRVFLPTAGYRAVDGFAYGRGFFGEYWSSCPCRNSAHQLDIIGTQAGIHDTWRASGCSVRCVQE